MAKEKLPTGPNGGNEDLKSRSEGLNDEQKKTLLEMLQQEKKEKIENDVEKLEIPQSLLDFRKKWEEEIDLDEDTKKKIMDAVNEIQKGAKEESDGSILVEFELSGKGYKTLDVNVAEHSDEEYLTSHEFEWKTKNEVTLGGMWGDNTKDRKNRALAEYVDKQRDTRDMEIRTVEFQRNLINELGDKAKLTKMEDKIAMWMYLTGNYGYYRGSMGNHKKSDPKTSSRSSLRCFGDDDSRFFADNPNSFIGASLCLIACQ